MPTFPCKTLFCAAILSFAGSLHAADAAPITIKFAHVVAEHTPKGQGRCCSRSWRKNACLVG